MTMQYKPRKDLTGQIFGKLFVDGFSHAKKYPSGQTQAIWHVTCSCGTKKTVFGNNLTNGSVKACGCLRKEGLNKKSFGEASFNSKYGQYKYSAAARKFEFKLSKDEFKSIVLKPCHYCGEEFSTTHHASSCHGSFSSNGIDRIDSSKGYVLDNCVPCCSTCNTMKMDMRYDEFISHMLKILKFLRKV